MPSLRTWVIPRIAFWVFWTVWLCLLQLFLADLTVHRSAYLAPLLVAGPPVLLTWIGSRLARNPRESPSALFWKGAAVSCFLGVYANLFLTSQPSGAPDVLIPAGAVCGILALLAMRGGGVKRLEIKEGELLERARSIARAVGVSLHRVQVFRSSRNVASAFANRMGAILLSERLLTVLSRRETDAVIAHEAAHLRRGQRMLLAAFPFLLLVAITLNLFWPESKSAAPFWPLAGLLLWRAARRAMEYHADASAVRATQDPEALITALTRVSLAADLPLDWSKSAGVFLSHPSMRQRFRAIARRAGISASRVDELVAEASATPPAAGYDSPFAQAQEWGILSTYLERVQRRMALLNNIFPIAAGVAFTVVEALAGSGNLIVDLAVWLAVTLLLYLIGYELAAGRERGRIKNQLPSVDAGRSFFAGLSTSAEPKLFGHSYHYDLGMIALADGCLRFKGTRCSFTLATPQVQRIWPAPGPRHWTPRRVVCIEYRIDADSPPAVVSFQSLERWFWPGTSQAAKELFQALTEWSRSAPQDAPESVAPPQIAGAPAPQVRLPQLWKPIRRACAISLCLSAVATPLVSPSTFGFGFSWFSAPVVTGMFVLLIFAPHLRSERSPS